MFSTIGTWALVLAMQTAGGQAPASNQQPGDGERSAPRRLTVTYSDGTSTTRLLTPRGGSWSPSFPHRPDAPGQDELPLTALEVNHQVDGDLVTITVALNYGLPHQRKVPVATIRMTADERITVEDLNRFGVDPIVLSIDDFPPPVLVHPAAASISALIDVGAELTSSDQPLYRITVRNKSSKAVMAMSYQMFRGANRTATGTWRSFRSSPVLEPAAERVYPMQVGSGPKPGFDRFVITAVLWDDGSVEGNEELKVSEMALAIGYAKQLRRILALLPVIAAGAEPGDVPNLVQIRTALATLPLESDEEERMAELRQGLSPGLTELGQLQVKNVVLADLGEYLKRGGDVNGPSAHAWLASARATYTAWLRRTGQQ